MTLLLAVPWLACSGAFVLVAGVQLAALRLLRR